MEDFPGYVVIGHYDELLNADEYEQVLTFLPGCIFWCCKGQRPYLIPTLFYNEYAVVTITVPETNDACTIIRFRIHGSRLKASTAEHGNRIHTFKMEDGRGVLALMIWRAMIDNGIHNLLIR